MSSISPISNLFAGLCSDDFTERYSLSCELDINDKMSSIASMLKKELYNDTHKLFIPESELKTMALSEFANHPVEDDEEYPVFVDTQEPLKFCPEITPELWAEICQRQEEATGVSAETAGINFDYGVTSTYCVPIHGPAVVLKFETVVELLLLLFLSNN
ncbi:hypothetical protein CJU89_3291 [Yarrowia sp. B02]|nr:hypothetical protein CJU89_3291 [Yarrowia sp. B02]